MNDNNVNMEERTAPEKEIIRQRVENWSACVRNQNLIHT